MEADAILTHARANSKSHGWVIFPLLRKKIAIGLVGWAFGILLGLGLFVAMFSVVVPYNYQQGLLFAVITTLILAVLLFIGLGSLWTLISDIRRLMQIDRHIMVLTPDEFVKQEGNKIMHVPLIYMRHVTARGLPPPDRTPPSSQGQVVKQIPSGGENMLGFLLGRGLVPSGARWLRRRKRTPTSLGFVDTRTNEEVIIVNDGAYGDPFMIAAFLKQYAASAQEAVKS